VTAGSGPQPQYSFNASTNHVTSPGYQYDAAGDVINDGNCGYTWDAEGHMSSATCPANSTTTTTYVYDAEGRRVAKEVGGAVTEADLYNTAGQVVSRYGPYPAETWLGDDVWVGGAHLAIYANGQTYFPVTDQVGTERVRFASTGGIVESCISLPFGDGLQCTGTDPDPYHFAKLERDAESGDDHAQHRDYNSIPGHWLSPDPAGVKVVHLTDPQTWNLYVYSANNPVTDNDPSGLLPCTHDGKCYEQEAPCAGVKVEVKKTEEPKIVVNQKEPSDRTSVTGVRGVIQGTITVNGKVLANTNIDEDNKQTLTVNGKDVPGSVNQQPGATNNAGRYYDTVGLLEPANPAHDAKVVSALTNNAVTYTDKHTDFDKDRSRRSG
jgi:RHS repeat-associated protein